MKLKDFVEGLNTLLPYFTKPDDFHIFAKYDEFFVAPTDTPLSITDHGRMLTRGWLLSEDGVWSAIV